MYPKSWTKFHYLCSFFFKLIFYKGLTFILSRDSYDELTMAFHFEFGIEFSDIQLIRTTKIRVLDRVFLIHGPRQGLNYYKIFPKHRWLFLKKKKIRTRVYDDHNMIPISFYCFNCKLYQNDASVFLGRAFRFLIQNYLFFFSEINLSKSYYSEDLMNSAKRDYHLIL